MIWAINQKFRIKAQPKLIGYCPTCNEQLLPKCGKIKVWHWSHRSKRDCDKWYEPETQWHINWKNYFPENCQEVVIGEHRADLKIGNTVIELQNSSISSLEIKEREEFYKDMIWIINGTKFARNLILRHKGSYHSFRWKSPPKSWWWTEKEVYIDMDPIVEIINKKIENLKLLKKNLEEDFYYNSSQLNIELELKWLKEERDMIKNKLFLIKKLYRDIPCGGWGVLIDKEGFLNKWKERV